MAPQKRILYISEEITPYLPSNPNSELGKRLPQMAHKEGYEVRIFMPRFGSVNERRNQLHEVIRLSGLNIPIADADHPLIIKVASMHPSRIQVYFVDNEDFFQRSADDINPIGTNRPDNDERTIFFTHGIMDTVKKLRWETSIVHCMGWMTSLAPVYIRKVRGAMPTLRKAKIIYTILPEQTPVDFQGENLLKKLHAEGIPKSELAEFVGQPITPATFHKLAIKHSTVVVFATPEPDPELVEYANAKEVKIMTMEEVADNDPKYLELYNTLLTTK